MPSRLSTFRSAPTRRSATAAAPTAGLGNQSADISSDPAQPCTTACGNNRLAKIRPDVFSTLPPGPRPRRKCQPGHAHPAAVRFMDLDAATGLTLGTQISQRQETAHIPMDLNPPIPSAPSALQKEDSLKRFQ